MSSHNQIDEEKRTIALRITELQSEIDKINEQIKSLIPQITSSSSFSSSSSS
jgi:hypothetical protein